MKKLFFALICVISLSLFTACNKEEVTSDPVLMEEILVATNKVSVAPTDLPASLTVEVEESYFETYIESAALVEGKGYEIQLGNEDIIYTNLDGVELQTSEYRRGRPHRPGLCGRGHRISIDSLPQVILDFVTAQYPNAVIKAAKNKGDHYLVLLNGHRILAFKLDGELIEATHAFRHCARWWLRTLDVSELSADITDYVDANYTNAEIKKAGKMKNGNIVVAIVYDGGRKIIIFDENGNFLFERG